MRRPACFIAAVLLALAADLPAWATPAIPDFWGAEEHLSKPDISALKRLRFLTTTDFPPFNFVDSSGRIAGFNVDLARAICAELEIGEACQIEAVPWQGLASALKKGAGEAIIAGTAITADARKEYIFSRPYLQFPARFVTRTEKVQSEPLYRALAGKRVGVMAGSAHEAMLRDLFPGVKVVTYTHRDWLFGDLRDQKTEAVFGDGMRLSFWLAGSASKDCCVFSGGPYLSPGYLGQGLAIAVARDNPDLALAIDYALQEISLDGTFAELYLRYFPVSFY